jgi:hypothetical protein
VERALGIQGWMEVPELVLLHRLASEVAHGGTVVEVGSWKGRSAVAMCDALQGKDGVRFHGVDTFLGTEGDQHMRKHGSEIAEDRIYSAFLENTQPYPFVDILRLPSVAASRHFARGSIDMLFIDADHTFDGVVRDIRHWFGKVKVGGVIAGHDYPRFDVARAVHTHFKSVDSVGSVWHVQRPPGRLPFHPLPYVAGRGRTALKRLPHVEDTVRRAWVSATGRL